MNQNLVVSLIASSGQSVVMKSGWNVMANFNCSSLSGVQMFTVSPNLCASSTHSGCRWKTLME